MEIVNENLLSDIAVLETPLKKVKKRKVKSEVVKVESVIETVEEVKNENLVVVDHINFMESDIKLEGKTYLIAEIGDSIVALEKNTSIEKSNFKYLVSFCLVNGEWIKNENCGTVLIEKLNNPIYSFTDVQIESYWKCQYMNDFEKLLSEKGATKSQIKFFSNPLLYEKLTSKQIQSQKEDFEYAFSYLKDVENTIHFLKFKGMKFKYLPLISQNWRNIEYVTKFPLFSIKENKRNARKEAKNWNIEFVYNEDVDTYQIVNLILYMKKILNN